MASSLRTIACTGFAFWLAACGSASELDTERNSVSTIAGSRSSPITPGNSGGYASSAETGAVGDWSTGGVSDTATTLLNITNAESAGGSGEGGVQSIGGTSPTTFPATGGSHSTGVIATGGIPNEPATGGAVGAGGATITEATYAGGGPTAAGGMTLTGGISAKTATGGVRAMGGARATGGIRATGGAASVETTHSGGGASAVGGMTSTGGITAKAAAGGAPATGGISATGGMNLAGGTSGTGGSEATDAATSDAGCDIIVTQNTTSPSMPTVGIVEWSTANTNLKSAQIVYTLDDPAPGVLNVGGTAPVDLAAANYHTLLLGLKPSGSYTFHVEAVQADDTACASSDFTLKTGALAEAPAIKRTATDATAQAKGFIVTSTGAGNGSSRAYIIDADGDIVWAAQAPASCTRARMDYEGSNMWMIAMNVMNNGGEMRSVSMDGATIEKNVSGLSRAHHDFTVLQGGRVAVLAWASTGTEVESDLLERSSAGTISTAFHVGSNLYLGGPSSLGGSGTDTYHCNSIHYYAADDTFTIGDRNPSLYVKVSHEGAPVWQFGGSCVGAVAPLCAPGGWISNHGHQLLDTGDFLFFSNGAFDSSTPSQAFAFKLTMPSDGLTATQLEDYTFQNDHSNTLGDIQRLPNGNTLVIFSNNGVIQELDSSWNVVQTLTASSFGYADWRETLYGPPARQ